MEKRSLLLPGLPGWRMAGPGGFRWIGDGMVESWGGSGLFWYAAGRFDDFTLWAQWRTTRPEDNSGVFLRAPALDDSPKPAIAGGYEIQIDDRGLNPRTGRTGDALHLTGAIYELAPARALLSRGLGEWNEFEIMAQGSSVTVRLNGQEVSRLTGGSRRRSGYIGLQNHHEGSAVQFRNIYISPAQRT
ncbi:hypothetical protein GCM10007276_05910 [Agaricicola taiwanensis]|uniref:3-keto-alpha-glucoside-1,2-lyase/3-keto-2-hydroxy-glucal hydratase domain-containing protein n=1 Tax=Agaricicola taiwanensis TaxID=591372 RepID=A0A8J2VMV5_9RHOB|nr:DUF1080 domain-containing protein [Agaricicola taiwanensis]GGE31540.1 hypothetical protein GCM10007276_05910 [Agaricicola taiwanensis]